MSLHFIFRIRIKVGLARGSDGPVLAGMFGPVSF